MPEPDMAEEFTTLYNRHYRQVYAYTMARIGPGLTDEVAAETFLIAWRKFATMPRAAPLPWLLAIARNVVRGKYRVEQRQRAISAEMHAWVSDAELASPDVADGVAERALVLAALARLSDSDRESLTLIAWDGLTPRDAARVQGCSTAAFFVRLHRARRRLTEAMALTEPFLISKEPIR